MQNQINDRIEKFRGLNFEASVTRGDWMLLASLNEQMLSEELKLLNDRIGWVMTSQSILFGAICVLVSNKEKIPDVAKEILHVIPYVALIIVVGSVYGIVSALQVIKHLEDERSVYQGGLSIIFEFKIPDLGSQRKGKLWWTRGLDFYLLAFVVGILLFSWVYIILYPY
jgi:hypothetical protein